MKSTFANSVYMRSGCLDCVERERERGGENESCESSGVTVIVMGPRGSAVFGY